MSLAELTEYVKSLPYADKANLMRTLIDDLIEDNRKMSEALEVWEIRNSPTVALALQQVLEKEQAKRQADAA